VKREFKEGMGGRIGDIKKNKKLDIFLGELKSLFTFAAAKNGRVH